MDIDSKIKLGLAVVAVGVPVVWLFSRSSMGKNIGQQGADLVTSLTKGVAKGLGKPILKGVEKGAVTTYNKALKPIGKTIFNKALKPGFKEVKKAPKKVMDALNPFSKSKKKAWKKLFRI